MTALLYIELRLLINTLKSTLKSPKKLIPIALMAFWIVMIIFQNTIVAGREQRTGLQTQQYPADTVWSGIFLMLLFITVQTILRAFAEGLLVFGLSQIDFLFPTPVPRRAVLVIKLMRDYATYALSMGFFVFVFSPLIISRFGIPLFPGIIVGWLGILLLLVTVTNLSHTFNIVLTFRTEQLQWTSRIVKFTVYGLISLGVISFFIHARNGSFVDALNTVAHSNTAKVFFLPVTWATNLMLLHDMPAGTSAAVCMGGLALLAVASFIILITRPENIYEPSLGISVKAAKIRSARKSGDMSAVVSETIKMKAKGKAYNTPIPPLGRGALAIIWKNAVVSLRKMKVTSVIWIAGLVAFLIMGRVFAVGESGTFLWFAPTVYAVWIGTQMAQREMRSELSQVNALKAMPLAGWKVMLAQTTYHCIVLSLGVFIFLIALALIVPAISTRLLMLVILSAPSVIAASVSGAGIAAPLYPDMKDPAQNVLANLIGTIFGSVSLIGSIVAGTVLMPLGAPVLIVAAIITTFNLTLTAIATTISGALYNKYDPTGE